MVLCCNSRHLALYITELRAGTLFTFNKTSMKNFSQVVLAVFLSSCMQMSIYSDRDKDINFNKYKTFAWLPHPHTYLKKGNAIDNDIVENNIVKYVSKELINREMRLDTAHPDVVMDFDIMTEKKVKQIQTPAYYNSGFYYYGGGYRRRGWNNYNNNRWAYNMGYRTENIAYKEGTLTIDMVDHSSKKLIWKGYALGEIIDIESFENELPAEVRDMFREYPVKTKK